MDYKDTEKFNQEISTLISDSLKKSDIIDKIRKQSSKEYEQDLLVANQKTSIISNTLEVIASMYKVKFDSFVTVLTPTELEKECKKLLKAVESKIKANEAPAQRILTFSVNDLYGHCVTRTVTKKDFEFVSTALSCHAYEMDDDVLFENIFDYSVGELLSPVAVGILSMNNVEYKDGDVVFGRNSVTEKLYKNDKYDLKDSVKKYFKNIISDDAVSLSEFSTQLTKIIANRRGDGGWKWITL